MSLSLRGRTICVLGADGYIGWPLCHYLKRLGAKVVAVDNCMKRRWERYVDGKPLVRIPSFDRRSKSTDMTWYFMDIGDRKLYNVLAEHVPDTIIHLAEQPSAPFSMMTRAWAIETQRNNVLGTLNVIFAAAGVATAKGITPPHIVKIGTMGEYGTPPIPIEEGWLKHGTYKFPFPKQAGSFYHLSKVHDSANLEFACRVWGFRVTDVNQGIVWGNETWDTPFLSPDLRTSFHADPVFGTVLNRFVAQGAMGLPLTVHGSGGQVRGFINLNDTLTCLALSIQHPPEFGEFRVINQLTDICSIMSLAKLVSSVSGSPITHVENPRVESEAHMYEVVCDKLRELGFSNALPLAAAPISNMIEQLRHMPYFMQRGGLRRASSLAAVKWRHGALAPSLHEREAI